MAAAKPWVAKAWNQGQEASGGAEAGNADVEMAAAKPWVAKAWNQGQEASGGAEAGNADVEMAAAKPWVAKDWNQGQEASGEPGGDANAAAPAAEEGMRTPNQGPRAADAGSGGGDKDWGGKQEWPAQPERWSDRQDDRYQKKSWSSGDDRGQGARDDRGKGARDDRGQWARDDSGKGARKGDWNGKPSWQDEKKEADRGKWEPDWKKKSWPDAAMTDAATGEMLGTGRQGDWTEAKRERSRSPMRVAAVADRAAESTTAWLTYDKLAIDDPLVQCLPKFLRTQVPQGSQETIVAYCASLRDSQWPDYNLIGGGDNGEPEMATLAKLSQRLLDGIVSQAQGSPEAQTAGLDQVAIFSRMNNLSKETEDAMRNLPEVARLRVLQAGPIVGLNKDVVAMSRARRALEGMNAMNEPPTLSVFTASNWIGTQAIKMLEQAEYEVQKSVIQKGPLLGPCPSSALCERLDKAEKKLQREEEAAEREREKKRREQEEAARL
eukprot:CAMPEP_0177489342 /NCGR_PEP_ID=MMETSP0369-20130122/30642_1 /TAXON_ID=447022 ORGANISM="Scrippsiella hangoei-like, Strain SHHI-4" /NCGR_SAMPLE_ID=MMETSP0369 /ASSEMBLY_ACC=CAM_ASM_000364 /LENGTH=493 /DNA_ID=CAMNT_0018965779 /DNA_START=1 /DNA_END=1479 /DNA_ORIENTATION=-